MPTFDQVPLQEAMLKTATRKTAQITQEYLGYIEQLPEDQAGRLQPDEGESVATIRRRLGVAAKLSSKDITIKRVNCLRMVAPKRPGGRNGARLEAMEAIGAKP